MRVKDSNHNLRTISEVRVKDDKGNLRDVMWIAAKVNGALRIIWRKVKEALGYIFTHDGDAIKTSDGFFIKCSDQ